jgi:LysM repeat protein
MVSQRRLLNLLTMFILLSLFAVACERPLGGTDDTVTDDQTGAVTDVNQGGGTDNSEATTSDESTTATEDTPTDSGAADEATSGTTADTTAEGSSEAGGGVGDASTDDQTTSDGTTSDAATTESTTDESTSDEAATTEATEAVTETTSPDATATSIPATHTVAAGENLYRIGLKYGISWVAIANANNLANPNVLTVGQVLNLPGATSPTPQPTPSPQTETTYIVQPGDNLFRIGQRFGISWVQIAEANGLVNPNLISAGDELKIPVDTPGPAPAFSHVVKQGETLFLISLQYGVAWPTIAEANNLTSPYVIYVGQTLEIPGK